jgi:hypothetical protein
MHNLIAVSRSPYVALAPDVDGTKLLVIDIGYSSTRHTCGVAWSGQSEAEECTFGEAIEKSADVLGLQGNGRTVLVLEAVLSMRHDSKGNPGIRGAFERGRGWYYGAGAVTLIAAQRFLSELAMRLPEPQTVVLAEAFLTHKRTPGSHAADASKILAEFWSREPVELDRGVEPISPLIHGVPPVRSF